MKIVCSLDPNKAHGWDSLSISMIKICDAEIVIPLCLIYENVSSDAKLFADDTSLFTVVYDEGIAADQLNRDLKVISDWAYQWKMQFNPDKKQTSYPSNFFTEKNKACSSTYIS